MHRLILSILSLIFLSVGCQNPKQQGLISAADMPNVLTDIHLIDGYLNTLPIDSARKVINSYYQGVFDKYQTDSLVFKRSLAYYSKDTKGYQAMYTQVEKQLLDLSREVIVTDSIRLDSIRQIEGIRMDSIRFSEQRYAKSIRYRELLLHAPLDIHQYNFEENYKQFLADIGFSSSNIVVSTQRAPQTIIPAVAKPAVHKGNPKKKLQQDTVTNR